MKRVKAIVATVVIGTVTLGGLAALARCQPFIDDSITKMSPDGKVIRHDGLIELLAVKQCAALDTATKDKIRPIARDWVLELQQQVIDNLDFVAEIEPFDGQPGFFDTFEPSNAKAVEKVGIFSRQLNSPGSLVGVLEFKHAIDVQQAAAIRKLVYEYDQAVMKEVIGDGKDPMAATRNSYRVGYRDALGIFHRLLDRAAPKIDEAFAVVKLSPDKVEKLAPVIEKIKGAKDAAAARAEVKALLSKLPLAQQRALLNKVRDLSPITDPFSLL
jgi:hypothetical protein